MKKFIKIESKGIIQEEAFTLLGASTKKDDTTKIGFFGSGLKYSIAYMLRNNINFRVFAEDREILFSLKQKTFREKSFDIICVNDKETSLTTSMGADWEAWFILREIYCNALDEGDSLITIIDEDCVPIEDKTVFYIEINKDFEEIVNTWNLYFSEKRTDLIASDIESNQIYAGGESLLVYRKGIRCHYIANEKSSFNYDMTWIEINESRIIKNDWDFKYNLTHFLQKIKDKKIITHLYNTINSTYEKCLRWDSSSNLYSDEWLECLQRKTLVPVENAGYWLEVMKEHPLDYLTLPSNLIEGLKERFLDKVRVIGDTGGVSGGGKIKVIENLTQKQQTLLTDSIQFLEKANYKIGYEIKIVDFIDRKILGQAKDEKILLSQKLFEMGRKQLVSVLIEENEHIITGFNDETREFQSHFINKYVQLMEEKTNNYL